VRTWRLCRRHVNSKDFVERPIAQSAEELEVTTSVVSNHIPKLRALCGVML